MKPRRGDANHRLGARHAIARADICAECNAAGFHKKACSQRERTPASTDRWGPPE